MENIFLKSKVRIVSFNKEDKRNNDVYINDYNEFKVLFDDPDKTFNKFTLQVGATIKLHDVKYIVKEVVFLCDEYHNPKDPQLPFNSQLYVHATEA